LFQDLTKLSDHYGLLTTPALAIPPQTPYISSMFEIIKAQIAAAAEKLAHLRRFL
jgi:hypothetical protein